MKKCAKCKKDKELSFYSKRTASPDGRYAYCKDCSRELDRKRQGRRYVPLSKEASRLKSFNWRLKTFGLTLEDYNKLKLAQSLRCGICGVEENKSFNIDHDHSTGKVRGLLCGPCNRAIGLFKESEQALLSAVNYLRKYKLQEVA